MVLGSSEMVFFSGMPSDAAGPVAESVTPTLMSAQADMEKPVAAMHARAMCLIFMGLAPTGIEMVSGRRPGKLAHP